MRRRLNILPNRISKLQQVQPVVGLSWGLLSPLASRSRRPSPVAGYFLTALLSVGN